MIKKVERYVITMPICHEGSCHLDARIAAFDATSADEAQELASDIYDGWLEELRESVGQKEWGEGEAESQLRERGIHVGEFWYRPVSVLMQVNPAMKDKK
jgi:hypothetical protein